MQPAAQEKTDSLSFTAARHCVEEHAGRVQPRETQRVPLTESRNRILAELVTADRDFPPFHRAARDGYAVQAADLAKIPATLRVIGEIKAGAPEAETSFTLQRGEAAAIMTGAPVPRGADAVIMVEYSQSANNQVEFSRSITSGENIVPSGSEARKGATLLSPGRRMTASAIALAASTGHSELVVFRRPQIAVLATGDELVAVSAQPSPNQIRNSNSYSLAAQIEAAGGEPILLPVAPDEPKRLRELIEQGFHSDLLLLSGGVSMGKYDLVEQILQELGAEFFITSVQIQPGRPLVFGRVTIGGTPKYFFGLPGNPVSTLVTFELFARAMVEALAGAAARKLVFPKARVKSPIKTRTGLTRFLPALLSGEFEQAEVELVKWQGSGDVAATAQANCYAVIPPDRPLIEAGEWLPILIP
jgi:molybdopterin molybdotransferase